MRMHPELRMAKVNAERVAGLSSGLLLSHAKKIHGDLKANMCRPSVLHCRACVLFPYRTMPKDRKVEMNDVATPNKVKSTGRGGRVPCINT
jgi:hypothetical protein